jgi:6-phosphogluconolactonase/glucosamine-6-phosphate isomerase/deaminase
MTYPLINGARWIAALITGASKHQALVQVAQANGYDPARPLTGVTPAADAQMCWYLDRAVAEG